MSAIDFDSASNRLIELEFLKEDRELIDSLKEYFEPLRTKTAELVKRGYVADPDAWAHVSSEALDRKIGSSEEASDIKSDLGLSNCVRLPSRFLSTGSLPIGLVRARRRMDRIVAQQALALFKMPKRVWTRVSGHFLYPPGGYMGWHTNWQVPGWRMYVTYAEKPKKSCFRYLDRNTGEVATSWDSEWDFRLFRVHNGKPFWHAVYSDTNRFSIGYRILDVPDFVDRLRRALPTSHRGR